MRLLDQIMSCPQVAEIDMAGRLYRIPGAGHFASQVADCPIRYVLEADVLEAADKIVLQWPDLIDPHDVRMRVPSERMWVEWDIASGGHGPAKRAGVLVEASPDGRSGCIRGFWTADHGLCAAQAALLFDFDRAWTAIVQPETAYPVHSGSAPSQRLLPCLRAKIDRSFHNCLRTAFLPNETGEMVDEMVSPIIDDMLVFFAFVHLLNASVPVRHRLVDRSRLNSARRRGGKTLLLDHVELSMAVDARDEPIRPGDGGARSRARLHLVRGHLVRRRNALFWRSPHLRGGRDRSEPIVPKTIRARLH
jgi:hypothetical protein